MRSEIWTRLSSLGSRIKNLSNPIIKTVYQPSAAGTNCKIAFSSVVRPEETQINGFFLLKILSLHSYTQFVSSSSTSPPVISDAGVSRYRSVNVNFLFIDGHTLYVFD